VGDNHNAGIIKDTTEVLDELFFRCSIHFLSPCAQPLCAWGRVSGQALTSHRFSFAIDNAYQRLSMTLFVSRVQPLPVI
jgi:hypothetical protein